MSAAAALPLTPGLVKLHSLFQAVAFVARLTHPGEKGFGHLFELADSAFMIPGFYV